VVMLMMRLKLYAVEAESSQPGQRYQRQRPQPSYWKHSLNMPSPAYQQTYSLHKACIKTFRTNFKNRL